MSKITRFLMVTIIVILCIYTLFPDNKLCFIRKCFTFEETKGLKYPDNVYIYIDPGHGARGTKPSAGTSSRDFNNPPDSQVQNLPNIDEKDVVLDIAIKVKNYLHQKGFKNVELTRTANIKQHLYKKVAKIKDYFDNSYFDYKKKCTENTCCDGFTGLFISIHCNGGPSKKSGAEAYHQDMGAGLAATVLDHLGKVMGKHLPSAKYKDLMVLREGVDPYAKTAISVKGTLAELGYIRNRKDYMKVVNNKDDIANAIAKGLINNALWQSTKNTINLCRKPDNPDDNYSDADGQNPEYMVDTESKILLPFEFFNHDTLSMLNKTIGPPAVYARETTADMVKKHPVMILPGGSLAGKENDSTLKQVLKQYVENKGTLIIFGQQFSDHLDRLNLFPGGESISSYGFREDQSCLKNSAYFSDMHPIMSSSTTGIVDVGVDGYFTVNSSSNAKVLLRRKINDEPVLLYYKYGAGTIFLTSLFTDYAYPRSMASTTELKLVKNMLRFAMAPDAYIPMFNLDENPNPTINLNIGVVNHSEKPAAKAKISVYTIDNTPVYETEVSVSLNPGESAEIPISFTLPDLESKDYGIGYSVYELKDSEDDLIQLKTETSSGRFSIYKLITPANIDGGLYRWITVNDDEAFWGQDVECTMHFKNTTHQVKQVEINNPYFEIDHGMNTFNFESFSVTLDPGETFEHVAYFPTKVLIIWDDSKITIRIKYTDPEGNIKQLGASKGVHVKKALTQSSVELIDSTVVDPGGSFNYSLHSFSEFSISGETTVKLALERYNRENSTYAEIETLFQGTHDYSTNGDFQHTGTYTPETVHPSGSYRLKLEVTAPNEVKELTRYQDFFYDRSGFKVTPGSIEPGRWLVPGETYTIPLYVRNISSNNDYHVTNGLCILRLLSPGNQEIFRKEITNINIAAEAQLDLTETFVFNPVETGDYTLEYAYEDETFSDNLRFRTAQVLYYWPSFSVTPDKPAYNYLDMANIVVKVNGLGSYTIQCQCPEAGVAETRSVQIPEPGIPAAEVFQVPLGMSSYYHVHVQVTDAANKSFEKTIGLYVKPVQLDCTGEFKSPIRAGFPLEFEVNLKGISGFSQPLTGELAVTSAQLNYQDIKTVTLQPIGENRFVYAIPVDVEAAIGFYGVDVHFNLNGVNLVNKQHQVYLPEANLEFSLPGTASFNAGDTLTLNMENTGGKPGDFEIDISLKDAMNKIVLEHRETRSLEPGGTGSMNIALPASLKSDSYILVQQAANTANQHLSTSFTPLTVTGITAGLHSFTLKNSYFEDELVSGQSEMDPGGSGLENSVLQARIIRFMESTGVEEQEPGEFILYNMIESGYSSGNLLYLVTDKGVLSYDVVSGNVNVLYSFDSNPGFNSRDLFLSSTGELWIASTYGIWKQTGSGQWENYTTADGLTSNSIYNIIEVIGTSGPETWAATSGGISVLRDGQWVNYTTANGLPANRTYRVAVDGNGAVWASTSGGVVKYTFNGTNFESVNAPFGSTNVSEKITSTSDGSVWMVAGSQLYLYQPGSDQWNQWNLIDLPSGTFSSISIWDMETVNNELWMRTRLRDSEGNLFNGLINYNGSFISYTEQEIPGLFGLNHGPLIPGSAVDDSVYFSCEMGFMVFDTDTWQHRLLNMDNHQLPGTIYCMVKDKNGSLWAGTRYGLSRYEVNTKQWTNYCSTPGNELLMDIMQVDTDGQNNVYGYTPYLYPWGGIIKIDINNGNVKAMPFPSYDIQDSTYSDNRLAVDTLGRIWLGHNYLYYYDDEGQWQEGPDVNLVRCMIKDFNGGVWLGAEFYQGDYSQFHLVHIKNDMTLDEYNASNSGLLPGDKDRLYLDQTGILWIKHGYYETINLQSFDGSNWTDYSNYEGFPQDELMNMAKDDAGKLWVLDIEGNLYSFENNQFVMRREGIFYSDSMVFSNGKWYCAGSRYGYSFYPTNFLKISSAEGLIEEELWSQNYPVNLLSGGMANVDLLTGKTFPAGTYELKTALMSSLQQELANSQYGFVVKDTGLSTTLLADGSHSGFLKPNTDLGITIEVLNNTPETKSNLSFTMKKISPEGTEEMIYSENFTLAPGQLEPLSFTFNESTTGTWQLAALLIDGSSGEEKESSLLIGVTEPMVAMEVLAPEYADDENFDVKFRLSNEGNINAQLNVQVSAGSETPIDETLTLEPLEERILTINDTISADKTYTIALSGDIEKTETRTVKYGYIEYFNINIQPAYREGQVSIGYTLGSGGGLPFKDQVHFELFSVGGTLPLYTTERNYHLYPDQTPMVDTIDIPLFPGNYQLNYHTSKQPQVQTALFVVQPSGIGAIAITPSGQYPVGAADITFSITNIDTFAGQVPVTLTLLGSKPGTPLLTETRDYYLLPGETRNDVLHHEFAAVGNYTLNFTGAKLPAPINSIIRVMNLEQVTANLSIGQLETDKIPVHVFLENSGYQTFTGTAAIEVDGIRHEEIIDVSPGSSYESTVELNTSVLTPGSKEVKAFLYDNAGNAIAQTTGTVIVQPANIKLTQYPENLEINAGSFGEVTLTLKNQGNLRGEAVLKINTFDTLYQEREVVLEPGEEIQLGDIFVEAPPDLPTGSYPFYYSLKGSGVENGSSAGNFNFKVNGLSLDIDASLDRSLYNPGETAALTLNITAGTASDAPLEAVVNWGIFSETRPFNLSSGSASLVFDIPLDEAREEKVFYGIYHEGGKGLHLNDIYLHFRGEISVETDKQVYAPGEMVHAVFTGEHTGILTVSAFAESYTLDFSSSASAGFQAPIDTLAGTYGIGWNLIPSDPTKPELSGSHPFDVSGLKVKVAKSELEKGKYAPGDTVNAHYIFESNRDQTLKLRNWVVPPSGDWTYLGESSVTVSSQQQVDAMSGYSFSTTEAGTHELVYGLYQPEGCENCDQLVVSGRLSFDVGNAVLLGINTDQWEYQTGDEPVTLKIDYFGEGFSQLQIYLDEENVHQQGITLSGTGSTAVELQSSSISGGSHRVKALLIQNNLTSTKSTGFTYGTHLPDLTAWLTDTIQDGLNYTFKLEVSNTGQTAGTASSLVFSDNGMNVGTASIPALEPNQSYEVIFNWSGSGKAGSHELLFEVDSSDAVKEFSETNNSLAFTLEVPLLFYSLETDPPDTLIYPANTPINIITRLINNQENPALLTLDLSITNEESGAIIHNQVKEEQIPGFGSKIITDIFNTGVYPAGNYTARGALFEKTAPLDPPQKLFIGEGSDSVDMFRELFLFFEPTKIVSGSLQIQPQQIPAKTPTEVQLSMTLKNAGNVPLEDEILLIDVFNTDLGEVVISEEFSVSIPLAEEITETKTMSLNLVEGNYEIWLKHHEEILALAELSAISAVKPSQTIAIYPRVLIMNLLPPAARGALFEKTAPLDPPQKLLIDLLQSQGIEYEVGFRLLDSYVKLNKSQANVNIVFGNKIGRNLRDELKEKVWHGEGLILFCDTPAQNHEWIDFPGVTIKPIPGKNRETVIRILPNEFCNAGEIELQGKIRFRMVKHQGDVVIIAQTQQKKYPVITYRKYGKGHILILIKSFCGGSRGAGFSKRAPLELFLNAITRFSQDIYTGTDLTRLLPLELTLKNESSEAKTVKIKTFLPYGVEAFDFQPEPEEGEELKWTITIPAVSTETISYWIKLPDQVNSFEIRTELYDEETKLDEVSTAFEVTQTVLFRINELILELDMINASGKDTQLVRKAKHHLEQIRNRSGDSFMVHLLNLHDSVKAASYLGEIKRVDVLNQWLKTQDIMIIMGRRFYESVKTWGEVQLNSILELL